MKNMSTAYRCVIVLSFLIVLASNFFIKPALSVDSLSRLTLHNNGPFAMSFVDGKPFLETLYRTASNFNDYAYDSIFTLHDTEGEQGEGSFYFKKIALLRVQVKTKGPRDGTIVIRQADGRVKIGGGHLLKFLKMTVSPDSRLLVLPNGYNVIKSDLANLLDGVKSAVAEGSTIRVTPSPVKIDRFQQKIFVLEAIAAGKPGQQLTDRIFIDPLNNVPIAWDVYRDGNWLSTVTFDNFRANIGLKDDFFKL